MESGSGVRQGGVYVNAGMVCGGTRCTGAEYAEIIADFDCAAFEIEEFEKVCETSDAVQVHYVITTTAEKRKAPFFRQGAEIPHLVKKTAQKC